MRREKKLFFAEASNLWLKNSAFLVLKQKKTIASKAKILLLRITSTGGRKKERKKHFN